MFSPYYALARNRGRGDPENHCAMNVALYGRPRRWAMTERGRASLRRDADHIEIGASAMHWNGTQLEITIDETTVPLPSRLRGRVVLRPRVLQSRLFELDDTRRHRWQPIAPLSDVSVTFDQPGLSWSGTGYFDTNNGDEALEDRFRSWSWSRFDLADRARIFYAVQQLNGVGQSLSLLADARGLHDRIGLPHQALSPTLYRMTRTIPCDGAAQPVLLQTLEDAPFYARSAVSSSIEGVRASGVHETLSLTRIASPVVRCMLPFKMFRRTADPAVRSPDGR